MAARKHWITHGSLATLDDADEVWLNLHDYTRQQAVGVVELVMKAAWERGYDRLTIVHGAADVTSPAKAEWTGRGSIKWNIRSELNSGRFMPYAYYSGSKKHVKHVHSNRITIALRPNASAERDRPWPTLPDPEWLG